MPRDLSSAAGCVCHFGNYELNSISLELRKSGRKLKLEPQPAKVLGLLAARAGELVTREEMRREIWGDQTFVDFERGLNYCLNSIRVVLGDDAHSPRYIETLSRRGYRFIAPVEKETRGTTASIRPSIAVLPFVNLSSSKSNAYFSDGLADEIITSLTRVQGLSVTSRTSSFVFRDQNKDVRDIGAKLGVSTLLEGSVQRYGSRIRVSVQLVSATDSFHLWSKHYDCKVADIFAIQDEISQAIAQALAVRLTPARLVRPTSNLVAYNSWLKARHFQNYEDLSALPKCRTYLDQAIALDPNYPQPYLSMADLFLAMVNFGIIRPREALAEGQAAIQKALKLDDSLGEIYALSGAYRALTNFDWLAAGSDFDRALQLTPGSEQAHRLRAVYYLVPTGRLLEAEQEMERAVELDPLSPLAYIELVRVLLWQRQFDRARSRMETAFELWPDYALAKWFLGVTFYFQGHIEEALALWRPVQQKIGNSPTFIGAIAMALAQLGHHDEARQMLAEMESAQPSVYVPFLSRAQVHVGLSENDAALQLLDRAIDEREPHILDLPSKPIWDGLRKDPRFTHLLSKMRLR